MKQTAMRSSVWTPNCISTSSTCMAADGVLWTRRQHPVCSTFTRVDSRFFASMKFGIHWRLRRMKLFWVYSVYCRGLFFWCLWLQGLGRSPSLGHHEEVVVLCEPEQVLLAGLVLLLQSPVGVSHSRFRATVTVQSLHLLTIAVNLIKFCYFHDVHQNHTFSAEIN